MKKIEYAPCQTCVFYAMNATRFLFFVAIKYPTIQVFSKRH
jgi:hypothetical protein